MVAIAAFGSFRLQWLSANVRIRHLRLIYALGPYSLSLFLMLASLRTPAW